MEKSDIKIYNDVDADDEEEEEDRMSIKNTKQKSQSFLFFK